MKNCLVKIAVSCTCGCGTTVYRTKYALKQGRPFVVGHWAGKYGPGWRGGKHLVRGYVYVWAPGHPLATKSGYVAEHRFVMMSHLKRLLLRSEVIHHKNGIKTDNRLENIQLTTQSEHMSKIHQLHKLAYTKSPRRGQSSLVMKQVWKTTRAHERLKAIKTCEQCQEVFYRRGRLRAGRTHVYCSRKCFFAIFRPRLRR